MHGFLSAGAGALARRRAAAAEIALPLLWGHPQSESRGWGRARARALPGVSRRRRRFSLPLRPCRHRPTFRPALFARTQNKIDLVKEDAARQHYAQVRRRRRGGARARAVSRGVTALRVSRRAPARPCFCRMMSKYKLSLSECIVRTNLYPVWTSDDKIGRLPLFVFLISRADLVFCR